MSQTDDTNGPGQGKSPPAPELTPAQDARAIVRRCLKGALATLDRETGHPYASLVTVATDIAGRPLILISRLARHTQNLLGDSRASILFDATAADGDPLAGGRVTLIGRAQPSTEGAIARRFLARHPAAAGYAAFADFSFYTLEVERAHYVGGFGRIVTMPASDILTGLEGAESLAEAESEIVDHMNEDHAATVALYATALLGAGSGPWRLTGVDPEGCDIVCPGEALRLSFSSRITSPQAVRHEFQRLAGLARAQAAGNGPLQG